MCPSEPKYTTILSSTIVKDGTYIKRPPCRRHHYHHHHRKPFRHRRYRCIFTIAIEHVAWYRSWNTVHCLRLLSQNIGFRRHAVISYTTFASSQPILLMHLLVISSTVELCTIILDGSSTVKSRLRGVNKPLQNASRRIIAVESVKRHSRFPRRYRSR